MGSAAYLAVQKELRAEFEPQLESGEKGVSMTDIPCVESLFGQRDMSRGAKVYFTLPLFGDYAAAAEKRRLSNLAKKRETNEKPQCFSKTSDWSSKDYRSAICERFRVQKEAFRSALNLRSLLHDPDNERFEELSGLKMGSAAYLAVQKELRAEFEPQLGSRLATKGHERPVSDVNISTFTARVCAYCQQEFGVRPGPGQSHGICRRHFVVVLRSAGFSRSQILSSLARKAGSDFCRDLAGPAQPQAAQPIAAMVTPL
jgi:hypothetical protein